VFAAGLWISKSQSLRRNKCVAVLLVLSGHQQLQRLPRAARFRRPSKKSPGNLNLNPMENLMQKKLLAMAVSSALTAALAAPAQADVNVSTNGGLKVESEDGNFKFGLGGRIHLDAAFHDDDQRDLDDGVAFRRARLFVEGTIHKDWAFKAQYDFAENDVAAKDLYIKYKPWGITLGQFKQPLSLEELTSSNYSTFIERASINSLATSRRIGVGYNTGGNNYSIAASVYGRDVGEVTNDDEGFGVGGRLTFAPWAKGVSALHLGVAASTESPQLGDNVARFRARPEANVDGTRLIDTGTIADVDAITKYGLEAALVEGPFSLQAEYLATNVLRKSGNPDADFDGYYVYGSWFLTGESRPYSASKGSFGRVKPAAKSGAWELAARYSNLNLNDGGITGGEMNNLTLGVNYYANTNTRLMFNYITVDTDDNAGNDDPSIFMVRAQVDF
jgi:phosphate-selective porin OprO/OprP